MVASQHVALDGNVAELSCAIETLHVAGRADVDAPTVVEQLVAADENIAHEVVAVETCPSIAVGEVVEDADVACSLYADAVISAVLDDIAPDDLSLAFRHWCTPVHAVAEARLVFHEDAIVAAAHTNAVRYDEVLVLVAPQPDAYAAASALAFRPQPAAFYHAYIINKYSVQEIYAKGCGWCASQDEVVEDGICQRTDVEGLAVGNVVLGIHPVGIDSEVLETHTLDGWEIALLGAFADEERPVRRANHLEDSTLRRNALQTHARPPFDGRAEDVFASRELDDAATFGVNFVNQSL